MSTETLTFTVDHSSKSIPITVGPTSGTLIFSADAGDLAAYVATGGGIADHTNSTDYTSTGQGGLGCYFGTVTYPVTIGGHPAWEMFNPDAPLHPNESASSYALCATEVTVGAKGAIPYWDSCGPYWGKSGYIPPSGSFNIPNAQQWSIWYKSGTGMGSGGGTTVPQSAFNLRLSSDRMDAYMLCGTYTAATGAYQYDSNFNVIPPGFFAANGGKWFSLLVYYKWESDNTGVIQTWYRVEGGPWIDNGVQWSGKPTCVWASTRGPLQHGEAGPKGLHVPIINYMFKPTAGSGGFANHHGGFHVGTSFQAVAAKLH